MTMGLCCGWIWGRTGCSGAMSHRASPPKLGMGFTPFRGDNIGFATADMSVSPMCPEAVALTAFNSISLVSGGRHKSCCPGYPTCLPCQPRMQSGLPGLCSQKPPHATLGSKTWRDAQLESLCASRKPTNGKGSIPSWLVGKGQQEIQASWGQMIRMAGLGGFQRVS